MRPPRRQLGRPLPEQMCRDLRTSHISRCRRLSSSACSSRAETDFVSKQRSISGGPFELTVHRLTSACDPHRFDSRAGRLEVSDSANCYSDHVRHVIEHASDSTQLRGAREKCPWAIQLTCRRKPKGTTACWKRRDVPKACRGGCGKARAIRRRLHCLNSRLQRCKQHIPCNHAWQGHQLTADFVVAAGALGRWTEANEASQGAKRSAYVALLKLRFENMGSPTGREPYGDGALVLVRGRESRPHGEGGQVSIDRQHARGTRDA